MHVCDLESDELPDATADGHHLAAAFAQVGYVSAVGDFILNALSREPVLQNADTGAERSWHNGDACPRVDGNLDLDPLVWLLNRADPILPDGKQGADPTKLSDVAADLRLGFDMQRVPYAC